MVGVLVGTAVGGAGVKVGVAVGTSVLVGVGVDVARKGKAAPPNFPKAHNPKSARPATIKRAAKTPTIALLDFCRFLYEESNPVDFFLGIVLSFQALAHRAFIGSILIAIFYFCQVYHEVKQAFLVTQLAHNRNLKMLSAFADRKWSHPGAMAFDEVAYPVRVDPGVIPERPTDGFIDEKFLAAEIVDQDDFQKVSVSFHFK